MVFEIGWYENKQTIQENCSVKMTKLGLFAPETNYDNLIKPDSWIAALIITLKLAFFYLFQLQYF